MAAPELMVAHDMLSIYRDEARRCATILKDAGLDAAAHLCNARADAFELAVKELETDWEQEGEETAEEEQAEEEPEEPAPRRRGPVRDGPTAMWPAERLALLRELWPREDLTNEQVLERLNALPGPPLSGVRAIISKVKIMSDAPARPHWTRLPGKDAMRKQLGEGARLAAARRSARYHSPDRDALIRELWPQPAITTPEIARRVAALSPYTSVSEAWVWRRAVALGLPSARFGRSLRDRLAAAQGLAA